MNLFFYTKLILTENKSCLLDSNINKSCRVDLFVGRKVAEVVAKDKIGGSHGEDIEEPPF